MMWLCLHGVPCLPGHSVYAPWVQYPDDAKLVEAIVERTVEHLVAQGAMPISVEQPLAVGFEEQAALLLTKLDGGRWLWLHGPGGHL